MSSKRADLAIVNRCFWPNGQVIGEALLQFAELAAKEGSVCVITQAVEDISERLVSHSRGNGVDILACRSYSNSASSVLRRVADALIFMSWVLFSLVRSRPKKVYVSTNPPVVVPFIVAIYCKVFDAKYVYHLQDIHPEAADIIVPVYKPLFFLLKAMDNYTLKNAESVVSLSEEMKHYIENVRKTRRPIYLLENPSFEVERISWDKRKNGVVFCGNAGRLQRIPLLINSIRRYLEQGGSFSFSFAGGGVFSREIQALADSFEQVEYLGVIAPDDAARLVSDNRWALLPIDNLVTKFAFPSKSSGYALSGAGIIAICDEETSVAKWVKKLKIGKVCQPNEGALVKLLFSLESSDFQDFELNDEFRERLSIRFFAEKLLYVICS